MVTAGELVGDATRRLAGAGVASPDHDARALLAYVLDDRWAPWWPRLEVGPVEAARFADLVARRADRVPLQHLTGRAYFGRVELAVGPGVFVPRPETETMTAWASARLAERRERLGRRQVVADLCTGSGAIAKSLAVEVPGAVIHAVELSPDAHAWAERNLAGTGVHLLLADMADALPELDESVDLVIANPPYVPLAAFESVEVEARDHDPSVALFSGPDGLEAIKVVTATAARLLLPGGLLAFEHAEVQADAAPDVVVGTRLFDLVRGNRDLTGRPRFVTAVRNERALAGWAE